jgi:predicted RNase H-like HicB family nuclease
MKKENINTKKYGHARAIIFPCKGGFRAVCLDFDIIEDCKTREDAEAMIKEAMTGYIKNVCKNNLDDSLLNRSADKKYWKIYEGYLKLLKAKTRTAAPKNVRESSLYSQPISLDSGCLV